VSEEVEVDLGGWEEDRDGVVRDRMYRSSS